MTVGNAGASDAVSPGANIFTDNVLNKHQRAKLSQKRYEKRTQKAFSRTHQTPGMGEHD